MPVQEDYTVSADGVEGATRILGDAKIMATRIVFPALVNDGANDTKVTLDADRLEIERDGGALTWEVTSPPGLKLQIDGPRIPTHNGYVQAVHADLPTDGREAKWRIKLQGK